MRWRSSEMNSAESAEPRILPGWRRCGGRTHILPPACHLCGLWSRRPGNQRLPPAPSEDLLPSQVPAPSLRSCGAAVLRRLPTHPPSDCVAARSRACLLKRGVPHPFAFFWRKGGISNLHQRVVGVHGANFFLQHGGGLVILILRRKSRAHCAPETAQRTESVVYRRRFVSAVHHAIRTLGIAGLSAVLLPFRRLHQFIEGVGVAVLQQVAGFLPAEQVKRWHAPWRTRIVALPHQKFKEQRRLIEHPIFLAVRQHGAEQTSRPGAPQKVL